MTGHQRLFYGISLAQPVRDRIAAAIRNVDIPGRLAPPANWHVTVRFLGDTPPEARRRLEEALDRVRLPRPFTCRIDRWGAFPRPSAAKVLWAGIADGCDGLSRLATIVEEAARDVGFEPETRPFRAHVTLARFREAADVRRALESLPPLSLDLSVTELALFRSQLGGGPARYEIVSRRSLAEGGGSTAVSNGLAGIHEADQQTGNR